MADDDKTAEQIAAEKAEKAASDKQTFTVARLREEAGAFLGVQPHEVAGAFAGVSDDTEVTVADAKTRINKWLKAEVTTDDPSEQE